MLSLSTQLFRQRVFHSFRYNCIKTYQTNANKLEKTLQSNRFTANTNNGFNQRFNKLESSLRRVGRITYNELSQCLNELSKSQTVRPTTTQSLLLIRSCGALVSDESPEKRRDLCQKMFETLTEVTDLDISHYNQLLRAFVENQFEFNAIEFLEKMQNKGIDPNRVTFILMIDRFCQMGNISEAIKILEHMKNKEMPISESVFNSLIIGYGKAGDLQTAEQTLDMMRSSGIEPSSDTYTALLCAYALNIKNPETEEKVNKTFDEINRSEIELSESDIFKVVKTIALVDSDSGLLEQMLNRIKKTIDYNKECLNVVNDLMFANKVDIALRIYETMGATEGQLKNRNLGNPLIRGMVRANVSPQTVISVCEKLQNEGKNESAIKNATEFALNYSNFDDCRTYLRRLSEEQPIRVHYFYPIIVKSENENQILEVLSEDLYPFTNSSYSQLTELFIDYIWPKNILDVHLFMEKCKTIGFSFVITFNSLIRYYILNDRIGDAIKLISSPNYSAVNLVRRDINNELSDSVLKPNANLNDITRVLHLINKSQRFGRSLETGIADQFGQFLLTLIRKQRVSQKLLNDVLKTFDRLSVRISEVSANAIYDRISLSDENEKLLNKMTVKSIDDFRGVVYHDIDDITKSRKDMTPEELEGHLIELKSKGLNTRGVLRSLLISYCRKTKFNDDNKNDVLVIEAQKRVQQMVSELNQSNHEFTNAMHAMLMEFFVNCGDIQKAEEMKAKINKDFEIDSFKIINMAALYVKNGEIEKAFECIKSENPRKMDTFEGEEVNSYMSRTRDMSIYRLLNSLIEAKADIKTLKEMFDLCIHYSAMTPTSVMAGPLVKYHILKEDYSQALEEFVNCVEKYRITPWKSQMIKHFLESGDQINLQKVIDCSNQIHGEMNTIMDLAAVCVESGKLKQAKKLFDTPGLRVRATKIDKICDQFVRENNIDSLEQLIRCTKNVFNLNRDRMLYHLIRGCIKIENTEKALNCWTLLQEEDIQPSDQTLILLANFLKQNNIEVPFNPPPVPIQGSSISENLTENKKSSDDLLHKFNESIKAVNIDEAIKIKNKLEANGKSLLMTQNCSLIEALLNSNRIDEAIDLSKSLLSSKLFPSPRIIRYLYSKLSLIGDYERLEDLRPLLPEFLNQNTALTNALAMAYINSGKVEELIDNKLLQMTPFPLGGFLRALETSPHLEQRLINISNDLVRNQDFHLPLNMVWIHLMKKERFADAQHIYNSCPKFKDFLLFSSLLDSIRENKNINLAKKLIETVSESNLTPKSIGITYSALIDVYIELGETVTAEDVVINEVVNTTKTRIDSKTETNVKLLDIEHLNRSTLNRLVKAIREREHREPKFLLQSNKQFVTTSSSSDDEFQGSSSDEEVVDIKTK